MVLFCLYGSLSFQHSQAATANSLKSIFPPMIISSGIYTHTIFHFLNKLK